MKSGFLGNTNLGLFLVRLGVGLVFIVSGWSKFMDIAGTTAFFGKIGLAEPFVYLVAGLELIGGLALLLGIWTRIFGWLLAIDMVFALYLVKYAMGFSAYRIDLVLLLAALGIAFAGAGEYALCKGKCDLTAGRE
ncbi:MAG: hypothetical protein ACD_56C00115G0003 [uncultured bacterium]|nr:MAG: hypothetical protein ACD_56C00115G0003 [uncultured bacterium]